MKEPSRTKTISSAPLARYRSMRNFLRTAEPRGRKAIAGKQRLRYYVQRHHARRPHYDFKARRSGAKVPQKPKSRKR